VNESAPRVAFFTDTFTETNGVALTSRQLEGFAFRRDYPFLCVRGALRTNLARDGSVPKTQPLGSAGFQGKGVMKSSSSRKSTMLTASWASQRRASYWGPGAGKAVPGGSPVGVAVAADGRLLVADARGNVVDALPSP